MKQIKLYLMGILLLGIVVVACKKNDFSSIGDSTSTAAENAKLKSKSSNLVPIDPNDPLDVQQLEQFVGIDITGTPLPSTESEAATMVAPLMANSIQMFHDLGLSDSDLLEEFSSLGDYKLAYVAFAMQRINLESGASLGCNSSNLYVKCLVSSLVPCSIMDYFTGEIRDKLTQFGFMAAYNSLSMTAKKAVLRAIGTRVSSWVGGGGALALTFFVYDFATCVINGGDSEPIDNGVPDLPLGTIIVRNDLTNSNDPLTFPSNYVDYVYYTKYYTHIGEYLGQSTSHVPKPAVHVYYNSTNSKYYFDPLFTKILPDGFYILGDDMNNNLSHKYREVSNGEVIKVAYIINPDPYRALEVFDSASHLPFF